MNNNIVASALIAASVLASSIGSSSAMPFDKNIASLGRAPSQVPSITRVMATAPVLAPMAHVIFCNAHKEQCESGAAEMLPNDATTFDALVSVNQEINDAIAPMQKSGLVGNWQIGPAVGDCNDYAVTKRDELIKRGLPASALLLAHVVTSWGEHHLVLVARTETADFVLDNLREDIRRAEKTGYRWVRIQSSTQATMWNAAQIKRDAAPAPILVAAQKPETPAVNEVTGKIPTADIDTGAMPLIMAADETDRPLRILFDEMLF